MLASACLPTVHHAVEIDGRAYWDGGFSANPDIVTLAAESPVADTLIVQLNPIDARPACRGARARSPSTSTASPSISRCCAIMELIEAAREAAAGWLRGASGRLARLAPPPLPPDRGRPLYGFAVAGDQAAARSRAADTTSTTPGAARRTSGSDRNLRPDRSPRHRGPQAQVSWTRRCRERATAGGRRCRLPPGGGSGQQDLTHRAAVGQLVEARVDIGRADALAHQAVDRQQALLIERDETRDVARPARSCRRSCL